MTNTLIHCSNTPAYHRCVSILRRSLAFPDCDGDDVVDNIENATHITMPPCHHHHQQHHHRRHCRTFVVCVCVCCRLSPNIPHTYVDVAHWLGVRRWCRRRCTCARHLPHYYFREHFYSICWHQRTNPLKPTLARTSAPPLQNSAAGAERERGSTRV